MLHKPKEKKWRQNSNIAPQCKLTHASISMEVNSQWHLSSGSPSLRLGLKTDELHKKKWQNVKVLVC